MSCDLNSPERLGADLRGSEAADAIGLNYRHSRARLWKILRGLEKEPAANPKLKYLFEQGKLLEEFSLSTYNDVFAQTVHAKPVGTGLCSTQGKKRKYELAATPDAMLGPCTIEIKSVVDDGVLPATPKPVHVIQCILQMYVSGCVRGHLFYSKLLTGEYILFRLHWSNDGWNQYIRPWLLEFLETDVEPKRMKNGEKESREKIILRYFAQDGPGSAYASKDIRTD
jgi:hypothetical protein